MEKRIINLKPEYVKCKVCERTGFWVKRNKYNKLIAAQSSDAGVAHCEICGCASKADSFSVKMA
jgi:hypothetical protein